MKVLMIAPCPYKLNNIKGGVEAVTVNLLKGFKQQNNVDLKLVSIRREIEQKEIVRYSKNTEIIYIPFGKIKSTKFEMLSHGRKEVRKIVDKFDPDIVHVQGNGSILFLTIGLDKSNLIVTQHGILWQEFKQQKTLFGKYSYLINVLTEKIISQYIQNYIFISDYNKNIFNKIDSLENHVKIYNPVNPFFFEINKKNDFQNRLLYIGGIMKRKGLLNLLTVIRDLNNNGIQYTLEVIGGIIEKKYKIEIDNFIKKYNIKHLVKFHGWLGQEDMLNIICNSDIFVLPSHQETLPVTIAETMAAGKVVIASNVGGIPEMIQDGRNGFIYESKKLDQLFNILIKINHNTSILREISAEAKISALEKYQPQKVVNKTIEFYKNVIKK